MKRAPGAKGSSCLYTKEGFVKKKKQNLETVNLAADKRKVLPEPWGFSVAAVSYEGTT